MYKTISSTKILLLIWIVNLNSSEDFLIFVGIGLSLFLKSLRRSQKLRYNIYSNSENDIFFRCLVKECEGQGGYFANKTIQDLLPTPNETCHRYQAVQADQISCDIKDYYLNKTIKCNDFVYETMNSIYAEVIIFLEDAWRFIFSKILTSFIFCLVFHGLQRMAAYPRRYYPKQCSTFSSCPHWIYFR